MIYLYKISNIVNGKMYIGQTNNPNLRWSQHKSNAKYNRGNQVITRAITKYGQDKFTFEVIAFCLTKENADLSEQDIIIQYDCLDPMKGYNIAAGGNTSVKTKEVLQKISDGLKKHYETNDGWNKGGTLSEEWKHNISIASIGKEGTNIGKKFNDDWKIKMSKSSSGKDKKSRRRFSDEVEKEICELYVNENKSTYFLEKKYLCNRSVIKSILIRNSIEIRISNYTGHSNGKNIFTIEQEIEICKKYIAGNISRSELARQFNCGKTTIRDMLLKHNIRL